MASQQAAHRRLHMLVHTLATQEPVAATAVGPEVPPAAAEAPPVLLDDVAVKQFLVDGVLALPLTDLPVGFHRELQRTSREGFEKLQAAGLEDRYVYNDLPAMSEVLASPLTRGALVSLLGPGYVQHPHRSMHVQGEIEEGTPRLGDGGWHKDGHHVPMRHHFPRWIIGFYYPFPCTMDMGPTGCIPGSHWLSVGTYNDGGWSGEPPNLDCVRGISDDDIVAVHDAKLRASAAALFPGAIERKTAVGDLSDPDYGTLFLLNFGILHRRCTRLPGSLWRNMFKLQWFRTAAPSVSWDHNNAEVDLPFAYTGASPEQQAVYEAAWSWMKGELVPPPITNHLSPPTKLEADLFGDREYKRVASAYSLGRHAAGGDASALDILNAALCGEDDDASRSAMYGCGGAGDAVVPMLCNALAGARQASDWRTQINVTHALNEAVRTPSRTVVHELQMTLDSAVAAMDRHARQDQEGTYDRTEVNEVADKEFLEKMPPAAATGYLGDPERAANVAGARRALSTCIQALGTLGERAVSSGDGAMVEQLVDVLLPYTVAPEPGAALESLGTNGRALSGIRPGQSEFWAREGAAIGLLRLASATPDDVSLVTSSTPGHHGDDRFIPALCQYAYARAKGSVAASGLAKKMVSYNELWASLADAAGANSEEPWLKSLGDAPGGGSGVAWLA